jgi:NitT/TauT family transport system ATP-binding protein
VTTARTTPVVEAAGVGKVFGSGASAVQALDDIDLRIAGGEFVSLIGPSGCGKSTLLRLIGDLTAASSGEIRVNGKPARQARLDRDYGMVFQAPVLMDWRTVARNIELPLEIMGFPRAERARRSTDLLRLVELEGFGDRHPWQLSGGMQQRVSIARALASRPSLLLMDEPFASVDAQTRFELEDLTRRVQREQGSTILVVTHDIDESVYLSDRVLVLSKSPASIVADLKVGLPADRDQITTRESAEFVSLRGEVARLLHGGTPADAVAAASDAAEWDLAERAKDGTKSRTGS